MSRSCGTRTLLVSTLGFLWFSMTIGATAHNISDKEEAEGVKFLETMRAKFEAPASEALRKDEFAKAIRLLQQELNEWKSKEWSSHWCKQTRKAQMISLLSSIAMIYEQQQRPDQAFKYYVQCENLYPEGRFAAEAANAYRKCKDFSKAEELYQEQIKAGKPGIAPVTLDAHISLAQTYQEEGNLGAAEQTLKDFVSVSLRNRDFYQVRAARIALKDLFTTENRLADVTGIDAILDDKTCPICGSASNVLPVAYGRRIGVDHSVHWEGCTHFPGSPQWWCNKDNTPF